MHRSPRRRSAPLAPLHQPRLWVVTVLLYGVGDLVTTYAGLGIGGLVEIGPVTAVVLAEFGPLAPIGLKFLVFGAAVLVWLAVPSPYSIGVPIGLCLVGAVATLWNLLVVSSVLLA